MQALRIASYTVIKGTFPGRVELRSSEVGDLAFFEGVPVTV